MTGVSCVAIMGRQWTVYCYIVERLIGCGVWCLDLSGFLGSCQDRLPILYLVGGTGLESICLALEFSPFMLDVVSLEGAK